MIDSASSQARLQLMMQYIHQNYSHNISLEELADHARISKSTALNLFRKFLHITPINYLIHYRLNEAALLLSKTEKKSMPFLMKRDLIMWIIFADYLKTL